MSGVQGRGKVYTEFDGESWVKDATSKTQT